MDTGLLKALVALVPVCMLLAGSAVMFLKARTAPLFLQLFGAACLLMVVFAHVFEALHLFPWMRWGNEQAWAIILISAALFLISRSSRWDTYFMRHAVTK